MVAKQLRLFNGNTGRNLAREYNFSERYRGEGNPKWKPKVPITCEVCGKTFLVIPSKADKAKYCSKECRYIADSTNFAKERNPNYKGGEWRSCEICGKQFWVFPCMAETAKFCYYSCRAKASTIRLTPTELSERSRKTARRIWDTPELRARMMAIMTSPKHRRKMSEVRKNYYRENPENHPNVIMARRQFTGKGGISKGQLDLYKKIKAIFIDAELNYPVVASRHTYFVDVAIPSFFTGYEYDGQYWHDNEKDKIRDKHLASAGWRIVHIKEVKDEPKGRVTSKN